MEANSSGNSPHHSSTDSSGAKPAAQAKGCTDLSAESQEEGSLLSPGTGNCGKEAISGLQPKSGSPSLVDWGKVGVKPS